MPQTTTWIGGASAVAEIDTITPGGTITTGDVNKLTITDQGGGTSIISFTTAGTTTAAAVSAGLIAAWNGNASAAALATASGSSTVVLTAVNPGVPIGVTSSVTGVGTLPKVTTQANSGPSDWATAANWSTAVVPGNGDTVYINELATTAILYGLNQAATGLTIHTSIGKTQNIGSANFGLNPGSGSKVYEGESTTGNTTGAGRIKYNFGGNAVTFYVLGSGGATPTDSGRNALQVTGGIAGTTIYVVGSSNGQNPPKIDIGMVAGQTGTIDAVAVSAGSAQVNIGSGITLTSFAASAGNPNINCAVSGTFNTTSGATVTVGGAGLIATATIGGPVSFNQRNGGTIITTLNVLQGGTATFSQNPAAGTVTTLNQYGSSAVSTNPSVPGHITVTTWNLIGAGTSTLST